MRILGLILANIAGLALAVAMILRMIGDTTMAWLALGAAAALMSVGTELGHAGPLPPIFFAFMALCCVMALLSYSKEGH